MFASLVRSCISQIFSNLRVAVLFCMLLDVLTTVIKVVGSRVRAVGFADELVAGWEGQTGSIANLGMVKFRC